MLIVLSFPFVLLSQLYDLRFQFDSVEGFKLFLPQSLNRIHPEVMHVEFRRQSNDPRVILWRSTEANMVAGSWELLRDTAWLAIGPVQVGFVDDAAAPWNKTLAPDSCVSVHLIRKWPT